MSLAPSFQVTTFPSGSSMKMAYSSTAATSERNSSASSRPVTSVASADDTRTLSVLPIVPVSVSAPVSEAVPAPVSGGVSVPASVRHQTRPRAPTFLLATAPRSTSASSRLYAVRRAQSVASATSFVVSGTDAEAGRSKAASVSRNRSGSGVVDVMAALRHTFA